MLFPYIKSQKMTPKKFHSPLFYKYLDVNPEDVGKLQVNAPVLNYSLQHSQLLHLKTTHKASIVVFDLIQAVIEFLGQVLEHGQLWGYLSLSTLRTYPRAP